MLLYDVIRKGAEEYPQDTAILFRDQAITYGELARRVQCAARGMMARGIGKGDRVAILLPNCPEFTVAYYAATAIGAIAVPANPLLKAPELVHIWGDAGARMAITFPHCLSVSVEARKGLPELATLVVTDSADGADLTFAGLEGLGLPEPLPTDGCAETDPAVFIYTSGTTGKPKGAVLSHKNLISNCRQFLQVLFFERTDNLLCVLPLFHSFAGTVCQNAALLSGCRFTIVELFQPARIMDAVAQHRVTLFPGVPAMYAALTQYASDRAEDFRTVRYCISGGAPMPVAVMRLFEERFDVVVLEGDGPTECSPATAVNPPEGPRKPGTIGPAIPGVEMRIFDDNDQEVPRGVVGEIVVRGDNIMLGYHNQPEATAEAMTSGWYHTGDLGTMDEDGYFTIVDRKKDMLLVGGINVYPREVEEVLYANPAIADAAVIGTPDPLRGDLVTAVVVLKPEAVLSEREIVGWCRSQLANYKVPRKVIIRDQLPRSDTGKVLKRLLRKELELGREA